MDPGQWHLIQQQRQRDETEAQFFANQRRGHDRAAYLDQTEAQKRRALETRDRLDRKPREVAAAEQASRMCAALLCDVVQHASMAVSSS